MNMLSHKLSENWESRSHTAVCFWLKVTHGLQSSCCGLWSAEGLTKVGKSYFKLIHDYWQEASASRQEALSHLKEYIFKTKKAVSFII